MSEELMWIMLDAAAGFSIGFGIGYVFGWTARAKHASAIDRIDREIAELDRQLAEMPDEDDAT